MSAESTEIIRESSPAGLDPQELTARLAAAVGESLRDHLIPVVEELGALAHRGRDPEYAVELRASLEYVEANLDQIADLAESRVQSLASMTSMPEIRLQEQILINDLASKIREAAEPSYGVVNQVLGQRRQSDGECDTLGFESPSRPDTPTAKALGHPATHWVIANSIVTALAPISRSSRVMFSIRRMLISRIPPLLATIWSDAERELIMARRKAGGRLNTGPQRPLIEAHRQGHKTLVVDRERDAHESGQKDLALLPEFEVAGPTTLMELSSQLRESTERANADPLEAVAAEVAVALAGERRSRRSVAGDYFERIGLVLGSSTLTNTEKRALAKVESIFAYAFATESLPVGGARYVERLQRPMALLAVLDARFVLAQPYGGRRLIESIAALMRAYPDVVKPESALNANLESIVSSIEVAADALLWQMNEVSRFATHAQAKQRQALEALVKALDLKMPSSVGGQHTGSPRAESMPLATGAARSMSPAEASPQAPPDRPSRAVEPTIAPNAGAENRSQGEPMAVASSPTTSPQAPASTLRPPDLVVKPLRERRDLGSRPSKLNEAAATQFVRVMIEERLAAFGDSSLPPGMLEGFLNDYWLRHLRSCYLKDGEQSPSFRLARQVMDDLLETLSSSGKQRPSRSLSKSLPPLVRELSRGLQSVGVRRESFKTFFDELVKLQLQLSAVDRKRRTPDGASRTAAPERKLSAKSRSASKLRTSREQDDPYLVSGALSWPSLADAQDAPGGLGEGVVESSGRVRRPKAVEAHRDVLERSARAESSESERLASALEQLDWSDTPSDELIANLAMSPSSGGEQALHALHELAPGDWLILSSGIGYDSLKIVWMPQDRKRLIAVREKDRSTITLRMREVQELLRSGRMRRLSGAAARRMKR